MFEFCVKPEERQLLPYRGMPVCLFMKDGSQIIGRMTAYRKGSVILNGEAGRARTAATGKPTGRPVSRLRARKSQQAAAPQPCPFCMPWPDAPFAPLSLGPPPVLTASQRDAIPLQRIDAVLIL